VSNAVGLVVRERLRNGLPWKKAITNAALGADQLHAVLTEGGVRISRRTVHTRLEEMYGAPVGAMPPHMHLAAPDLPLKVRWIGANTYDLKRDQTTRRGLRLLFDLLAFQQSRRSTDSRIRADSHSLSGPTRLRANLRDRRVAGMLRWAIGAAEGRRNNLGNWLAWRCSGLGLDLSEVEDVMERFQEEVCVYDTARNRYTRREAVAQARRAFRKAGCVGAAP
jgi:hypothetical protein